MLAIKAGYDSYKLRDELAGSTGGCLSSWLCWLLQENVTAVLTQSPTDVLSHVAIRARSQGVLLATCFDEAALGSIKQMEGKNVRLNVDATGAVIATESAAPSASNGATPKSGEQQSTTAAFGQVAVCELCTSFLLQSMFVLWHQSSLISSVLERICALRPPALAKISPPCCS